MGKETRVIRISQELYDALENRLARTTFKTVDEMAENLLLKTFDEDEAEVIDKTEEEQIKKRLQDLGYL